MNDLGEKSEKEKNRREEQEQRSQILLSELLKISHIAYFKTGAISL